MGSKHKRRKVEISPPERKEGMMIQPMYDRNGKFYGWAYITMSEWSQILRMK